MYYCTIVGMEATSWLSAVLRPRHLKMTKYMHSFRNRTPYHYSSLSRINFHICLVPISFFVVMAGLNDHG